MILALILMQAAAPLPRATDPVPDDLVVIGEQLKRWAGRISSNPLGTRCRTTASTGGARVDAIGCRAMAACWPEAKLGLKQVGDKRLPAADRQRIKAGTEAAFGNCSMAQRRTLIPGLVATGAVREGQFK